MRTGVLVDCAGLEKVKELGDLEAFMLIAERNHDPQHGLKKKKKRNIAVLNYDNKNQKYTHFVLPEASTAGKGTQPDSTFKKGLNFS